MRPTAWRSLLTLGAPKSILPQGFAVVGNFAEIFSATGFNCVAGLGSLLLTNGAFSCSGFPALQAAEANAVKSPFSMSAVGMKVVFCTPVWRFVVPWYP